MNNILDDIRKYNKIILHHIKYVDKQGNNILHLAIEQDDNDLIEKIINSLWKSLKDENFLSYINSKNQNNYTPLDLAYLHENNRIIEKLKKFGAKEHMYFNKNKDEEKDEDYIYINKNEDIDENLMINFGLSEMLNKKKQEENELFKQLDKAKPKGLINIYGSCYLNTVLQCLFHIKPLSLYFLKEKNRFYDNTLSKAYCSVVLGLLDKSSKNDAYDPTKFKEAIGKLNSNYMKFGNDPKSVIMDFIYHINDELLMFKGENSVKLNNNINRCQKKELFQYYQDEAKRAKTKISELFGSFTLKEKRCIKCKKSTFDFIYDFYFIFNLEKLYKSRNPFIFSHKKRELNLEDCFKEYFKIENKPFTCQNKDCSYINNKGIIIKKLYEPPKYLIIILDRGKNDKFNCQVYFKRNLDLSEVTEIKDYGNKKTNYQLIGATFLFGRSGGGHTVAFCKHFDNQFYLFDDQSISGYTLNELKNNKSFLLFYERIIN